MQSEHVTGVAEDPTDVGRDVAERVARVPPVRARVDEAAAVGVDEAAQKRLGVALEEVPLPVHEDDGPLVLASRSVLRKQARPTSRVRRELDVRVLGAVREATGACPAADLVVRTKRSDRRLAGVDDARVAGVEPDAEPEDAARVGGDAAIPEVEAERVHVLGREGGEVVLGSLAVATLVGGGVFAPHAAARRRAVQPIADGRARQPGEARDLGGRATLVSKSEDVIHASERVHTGIERMFPIGSDGTTPGARLHATNR